MELKWESLTVSEIRVVYTAEPNFPATDQHPDAKRYKVNQYWVDAVGKETPTIADVEALLHPPITLEADQQFDAVAFLDLLTDAEYEKLIEAAGDMTKIARWLDRMRASGILSDADAIKSMLVQRKVLTKARAEELFSA